jgi:phage internal scaffolding protein
MLTVIRYPYQSADALSLETALWCDSPDMAQQQFKDECDINTIARRFGISGQLPVNGRAPSFGDFTGVDDYHSAMTAIREAQESFMALPGLVRERFGQDPQRFVEFCSDPRNIDQIRELGLAPPAPVQAKTVQEAVKAASGEV